MLANLIPFLIAVAVVCLVGLIIIYIIIVSAGLLIKSTDSEEK